jgi:hypothetical protein
MYFTSEAEARKAANDRLDAQGAQGGIEGPAVALEERAGTPRPFLV